MIDSQVLGEPVSIAIAGAVVGVSTSDTAASWTVLGAASIGDGTCVYAAGDQALPHGTFTLVLTSLAPHGTLDVLQHVQATVNTDCGPSSEETLHLEF
jgi:hypothetical protein